MPVLICPRCEDEVHINLDLSVTPITHLARWQCACGSDNEQEVDL